MTAYKRDDLLAFALALLTRAGLPEDKAAVVAELLVKTDEMGVTTHGVSLIPYYLPELTGGTMTTEGTHEVVQDRKVTMVWDGNYLPGHWLMQQALDTCMTRAAEFGMAALSMRRAHHIGCLSTLTRIVAEQGFVCYIATSDPSGNWVAPFGGTEPLLTPNPWAVGYPTDGHPVLIDTCASITTVSKVRELVNTGVEFAHPWMLTAEGQPSTDPTVVNTQPKGSIMPVGGADHGHKGFAMAVMVEMLTQGLSGHGRAENVTRWGGNVFLQVIDPEAFGGREGFVREVSHLGDLCRANRPIDPGRPVRMPGDRANEALAASRAGEVRLPAEVATRLATCAADFNVPMPAEATLT
ncbi:Ldh family oxidoreductase [Oceanicola sp. 502str15]|uniref:Ldh family oxidoreductase n=1 Tax=Oceanicola sp. 502str15 TaxID=2696061 RepID=UPI002094B70F|nr:Ldh family oxidoreductase [Oceanicola sp. 502str15]MCO6384632.1 Ldh family oxidoreductase [Oceanicola sp. 502str15]